MELRKAVVGRQLAWTEDEIVNGVLQFMEKNGRFPRSVEFDTFDYLPSARSIQRTFGGLAGLKTRLGVIQDYHRGEHRSEICRTINERGQKEEEKIYKFLINRFGEICVHREQLADSTNKERLDFVVYHKEGKFGIDVFWAESAINANIIVNNKLKKYTSFQGTVVLLSVNQLITESELEHIRLIKGDRLSSIRALWGIEEFSNWAEAFQRYTLS